MTRETVKQVVRPKRTPINGRNVLTVSGKDPNYVYRIVNDVGGRIDMFKEAGYEMVLDKDVKVGDRRLNNSSAEGSNAQVVVDKQGTKAFVMRIPKEWYDEDQAAKQAQVLELEQTMKKEALSKNDLSNGMLEITRG
jgi:hypothetical protein